MPGPREQRVIAGRYRCYLHFFFYSFKYLDAERAVSAPESAPELAFFYISGPYIFFKAPLEGFSSSALGPYNLCVVVVGVTLVVKGIGCFANRLVDAPVRGVCDLVGRGRLWTGGSWV